MKLELWVKKNGNPYSRRPRGGFFCSDRVIEHNFGLVCTRRTFRAVVLLYHILGREYFCLFV